MSVIGNSLSRLSGWIDGSYPATLDTEVHLRRRIDKLMEEVGEVGQALGGMTGENPRKGFTHSREHVMKELLDVAVTALGAWEHMDENQGRSEAALEVHLDGLLTRVNLGAEPGHMIRGYSFDQNERSAISEFMREGASFEDATAQLNGFESQAEATQGSSAVAPKA